MSKSKSKSKRKPPAKKRSPAARSGEKESTPVQQAPQRSGPNWNFIAVVVALIAIPVAGFLLYRNWYIASLPQGEIDGGLPNQRVNADQPFSGLKHGKGTAWETTVSQSETWNKIDNASGDGWDTEVFANKVTSQLKKLKKIIAKIDSAEASAVDSQCSRARARLAAGRRVHQPRR